MDTVISDIHIIGRKTGDTWAIYPDGSSMPMYMELKNSNWVFVHTDAPHILKSIEAALSDFIKLQ